jgi:hypothetical protein
VLGDAAVGRLVAAAAAWLAPGPADPQPATATNATSVATLTMKRLFMSLKTPMSAARLRSAPPRLGFTRKNRTEG